MNKFGNKFQNAEFENSFGISCSKIIYRVVSSPKTTVFSEEMYCNSDEYGISATENNKEICRIDYISPDYKKICLLADKLNQYEASVYHFREIVEDFLFIN